jgi:hypothetical protein
MNQLRERQMRLHDIEFDDDDLAKLWQSEESMAQIATRLGIEPKELAQAWRYLKRKGRLPMGDRPRRGHEGFDTAYDGRPKVSGVQSGTADPLLTRLDQKHPERRLKNEDGESG